MCFTARNEWMVINHWMLIIECWLLSADHKLVVFWQMASSCQWFSGKIQRCHRWAPGSIPGWRTRAVHFSVAYWHREEPLLHGILEINNVYTIWQISKFRYIYTYARRHVQTYIQTYVNASLWQTERSSNGNLYFRRTGIDIWKMCLQF